MCILLIYNETQSGFLSFIDLLYISMVLWDVFKSNTHTQKCITMDNKSFYFLFDILRYTPIDCHYINTHFIVLNSRMIEVI